jgi:hypothetical protein
MSDIKKPNGPFNPHNHDEDDKQNQVDNDNNKPRKSSHIPGTPCCKFDAEEVRRNPPRPLPDFALAGTVAVRPNTIFYAPADQRVQNALNNISEAEVKFMLEELTGARQTNIDGNSVLIESRNSHTYKSGKNYDHALRYVEQKLANLGLKAERFEFDIWGRKCSNLIVKIAGRGNTGKVVMLGAHLDSTAGRQNSPERKAPGADDDGSGTVALLAMAKELTKFNFENDLWLCFWGGEEQGLYGSKVYADYCNERRVNIIAMYQTDMIGWCAKPGNRVDIHDDKKENCHQLVMTLVEMAKRYRLNLNPVDTHNNAVTGRSDHAPFQDYDYPAVLTSEEFSDDGFNPNYHKTSDTADTLNIPYLCEVVRMIMAAAIEYAVIS